MCLTKTICVLSMYVLLSACAFAQAVISENDTTKSKQEENTSSFIFSFRAIVTDVIDGCTIKVEIKEERRGEIQGQEFDLPSSNPDYKGIKIVKIVNTKCVSMDKASSDEAKEMLGLSVKGKIVKVLFKTYADIKNSKMVGQIVIDENGNDVGLEQLKAGMVMFCNDKEKTVNESDKRNYRDAEKNAKEQKIGLWSNR